MFCRYYRIFARRELNRNRGPDVNNVADAVATGTLVPGLDGTGMEYVTHA